MTDAPLSRPRFIIESIYYVTAIIFFVYLFTYFWTTEGGPTFGSRWENVSWTKPLLVIVCLTAFSFALDPLGFLLSSIPLMVLLLRLIDPVRWSLTVPIALLVPLGMWWVLKRLLLIQLPSGIFEIG